MTLVARSTLILLVVFSTSALWAEDRSWDGSGNSLPVPTRGAAQTPMIRFGYRGEFADGLGAILGDEVRGNARDISNALFAQSQSVKSARGLSDYLWAWGQFMGHDLSFSSTSAGPEVNGTAPIAINDPSDPLGPNPIPFTRANWVTIPGGRGGATTRMPINEVTSYLDASQVYGSSAERAAALRGPGGKLLVGPNYLLPQNSMDLEVENFGPLPNDVLYAAGDIRANENPLLTSLHTVFVREHNRLVDLIAVQQPELDDDARYQLARKLVGAEMQAITYNEFLPALLGHEPSAVAALNPRTHQYGSGGVTGEITNAFAHMAFRFGHSAVSPTMKLVDGDGTTVGSLAIRDAFYNPLLIGDNPELVDQLLRGAAAQRSEEIDVLMVDDLRNFLFGPPGAGGLDLAAINIQRGRDVGLPDYNELRKAHQLPGLPFDAITSDSALAEQLAALYDNDGNNIDAWVGALVEDHLPGASVGPLMAEIIESQFQRLRDGDRFFYTGQAAGLYAFVGQSDTFMLRPEFASLVDLDTVRLSDIIRWNTGIGALPANVFFVPEPGCATLLLLYITTIVSGPWRSLKRTQ